MIVIQGTLDFDPDRQAAAVAAAAAVQEASRKDPGCLTYAFALDVAAPGRFHIVERWESEEDLKSHLEAPHTLAFIDALRGVGAKGSEAVKFQVSSWGPVR